MLMSSSVDGLMSSHNNRSSIFCSASSSISRASDSQYESFRWWLYKGKSELSVSVSSCVLCYRYDCLLNVVLDFPCL